MVDRSEKFNFLWNDFWLLISTQIFNPHQKRKGRV